MGKFAGFLKRVKRVAGFASNVLSKINDVYKSTKPIVQGVVNALPGGGYINQALDFGSNVIDKITPMTNKWIETSDRTKINEFTDKAKRLGSDVMFKLTNEYTKAQQERMNDFDEKNLIFGNPIN